MSVVFVGMTVREREQRQRLRDLAIFERINGNTAKTSADLAVKKVFIPHFQSCSLDVFGIFTAGT